MKQLLLPIIVAILSTPAQGAMIKAVATDVVNTYGGFSQTPGGTALDINDIESAFTDNYSSLASSSPSANPIYGLTDPTGTFDYVAIDLDFGSSAVVTGQGADLVIFSEWAGSTYSFGLAAYANDTNKTLLSSYNYTVDGSQIFTGTENVAYTSIDLFNNDPSPIMLDDNIEIGHISLFIGDRYNGSTGGLSNISLAAAYHVTPVPLPLPIILFASGLTLLGWIGRRKSA